METTRTNAFRGAPSIPTMKHPEHRSTATSFLLLLVAFCAFDVSLGCSGSLSLRATAAGVPFRSNVSPNYTNNAKCAWYIRAVPGKIIRILFSSFELEDSNRDEVRIYDGLTTYSALLAVKTGTPTFGLDLYTSSNVALVTFTSDYTRVYAGFRAIAYAADANTPTVCLTRSYYNAFDVGANPLGDKCGLWRYLPKSQIQCNATGTELVQAYTTLFVARADAVYAFSTYLPATAFNSNDLKVTDLETCNTIQCGKTDPVFKIPLRKSQSVLVTVSGNCGGHLSITEYFTTGCSPAPSSDSPSLHLGINVMQLCGLPYDPTFAMCGGKIALVKPVARNFTAPANGTYIFQAKHSLASLSVRSQVGGQCRILGCDGYNRTNALENYPYATVSVNLIRGQTVHVVTGFSKWPVSDGTTCPGEVQLTVSLVGGCVPNSAVVKNNVIYQNPPDDTTGPFPAFDVSLGTLTRATITTRFRYTATVILITPGGAEPSTGGEGLSVRGSVSVLWAGRTTVLANFSNPDARRRGLRAVHGSAQPVVDSRSRGSEIHLDEEADPSSGFDLDEEHRDATKGSFSLTRGAKTRSIEDVESYSGEITVTVTIPVPYVPITGPQDPYYPYQNPEVTLVEADMSYDIGSGETYGGLEGSGTTAEITANYAYIPKTCPSTRTPLPGVSRKPSSPTPKRATPSRKAGSPTAKAASPSRKPATRTRTPRSPTRKLATPTRKAPTPSRKPASPSLKKASATRTRAIPSRRPLIPQIISPPTNSTLPEPGL
mmetsp:Transcript_26983/g.45252  ORF Transcript_26983/g.45252 Transcript_26983/m.45252 type:complete len:771 (-) Transcript_26983:77-2389(-)